MLSRKFTALAALAAVGTLATGAMADDSLHLLTKWTFEVSVPVNAGPHANEEGDVEGFASGFHAGAATVYSNPVGNGSLESFSSNNWSEGDYYQFTTSTVGFEDIVFGWSQTRSGTGPANFVVQWSGDGEDFETLLEYTVAQLTWTSLALVPESVFEPVALPVEAAGLETVWVRVVSLQTTAAAGTNRIDDVFFSGVKKGGPTDPCQGDINGDDVVDGADLGQLLGAWGPVDEGAPEDLNGDGVVDGADLGILLGSWGPCPR
ncbi:MAG TPA: hypothetical protein PKC43_11185 [Phycisphaerales bacterium]|nr:hypothetical protein [Phycisphaerales bacterium]HMP37996.1 hypothetical protein [Phycisphaerales bacterium]